MIPNTLTEWAIAAHAVSVSKGFYDETPVNLSEKIALMHQELSELLETLRYEHPQSSKKIPEFLEEEEEAADIFLRLMCYCQYRQLRIEDAVRAKIEYNKSRPFMHGKKF